MTNVTVQETADGDLYIQLPDELMNDLGWTEDTELVWIIEDDGRIILRKNTDDPSN
jgi:bifunctional DNA-binding transcriptional regulator/antitoxin component of YhaV-PrlF toxin-antitoxin module